MRLISSVIALCLLAGCSSPEPRRIDLGPPLTIPVAGVNIAFDHARKGVMCFDPVDEPDPAGAAWPKPKGWLPIWEARWSWEILEGGEPNWSESKSARVFLGRSDEGQAVVNGQPVEGPEITIRLFPDGRTDPAFPELDD